MLCCKRKPHHHRRSPSPAHTTDTDPALPMPGPGGGGGDEQQPPEPEEELAMKTINDLEIVLHAPEEDEVPAEIPPEYQLPPRPDDLYAPQATRIDFGCLAKCFPGLNFRNTMWKFKRASRHAEAYWDQTDAAFDQIREVFKFTVLPQKASLMTEISSQLWALAYCHKDIISGDEEEDQEDMFVIALAFAKIILEGEKVVTILQHFMEALNELITHCMPYIHHMNHIMNARLVDPNAAPILEFVDQDEIDYAEGMNEKLKTPIRRILLCRKAIEFQKRKPVIQTYMRMGWQKRWYTMDSFPRVQKLRHVCDSLARCTFDITRIAGYLNKATDVLARGKHCLFDYDFLPQIKSMHKNFLKMCLCEKKIRVRRCKKFLIREIKNAQDLVNSLEMHGKVLDVQILEMVGMAHLCFNHVIRKTGGYMTYETMIQEHCDENYRESNVPTELRNFYEDCFYRTRYSDVLRKLPAGFNNAEICLHIKTPTELKSTIKQLQALHQRAKQLRMKRWPWSRLNPPGHKHKHKRHFQRLKRTPDLNPAEVEKIAEELKGRRGHHGHHKKPFHQQHKLDTSLDDEKHTKNMLQLGISPISSKISTEGKSILTSKSTSETSRDDTVAVQLIPIHEEASGISGSKSRTYQSKRRSGVVQDHVHVDKKEFERATKKWKRKFKLIEEEAIKKKVEFPKLSYDELQRRLKAYKGGHRASQPDGHRASQPSGTDGHRASQPSGTDDHRASQPSGTDDHRASQPSGTDDHRASQPQPSGTAAAAPVAPTKAEPAHVPKPKKKESATVILPYTPWWHPPAEIPAMPPAPTSNHSEGSDPSKPGKHSKKSKSKHKGESK